MGKEPGKKKGQRPASHNRLEPWTEEAHHTWQIDGKEHVELSSGQKVSWLNIADEGTGSLLDSHVHTPAVMTQWTEAQACAVVEQTFEEWTMPERIKIDNGLPFVNSKCRDNPTMPVLWWIGMGIEVIQNTPARPQENGIVENLQGTTHRWVNPVLYQTPEHLQQAVRQIAQQQREVYRIRRKGNKTRTELHPELQDKPRPYHRENFDIQRVFTHLAQFVWERKVQTCGRISLFGYHLPVGSKWKGQKVCVIFDPKLNAWIVSLASDGTQLNIYPNTWISKETIFQTIGFSKN